MRITVIDRLKSVQSTFQNGGLEVSKNKMKRKVAGRTSGKYWFYYFSFSLLTFVSIATHANSPDALVGSGSSTFSVGQAGRGVWELPIAVPQGIRGLAPQLTISLTTGSSEGNILGVGGHLAGLSVISRCARTMALDGVTSPPHYVAEDQYCLNGVPLVLANGVYGASGSEYRTAVERFQRIVAHGSSGSAGPAYFEVTNRVGSTIIFGQDARRETFDLDEMSLGVSQWRVDRLQDINGNTVTYHYRDADTTATGREILLDAIHYGGNIQANTADTLRVVFDYESDVSRHYWQRGTKYIQSHRLAEVRTEVDVNGSTYTARTIKLSYLQDGAYGGQSRLASVTECGEGNDCYRPTTFNYTPADPSLTVSNTLSLPASMTTGSGLPSGQWVDINYDGRVDWVSAFKSESGAITNATWLGDDNGWQASQAFTLPDILFDYETTASGLPYGQLVDVNGDGWVDYVSSLDNAGVLTDRVWLNRNGFWESVSGGLPILMTQWSNNQVIVTGEFIDLNQDGLVDILSAYRAHDGAVSQQAWLQDQQGQWRLSVAYTPPGLLTDYHVQVQGQVNSVLQDVNGDGLIDWITSYIHGNGQENQIWLNTGQGWQNTPNYQLPIYLVDYRDLAPGEPEGTLTDINGDGLVDLVRSNVGADDGVVTRAWTNTGLGWQATSVFAPPAKMTWMDTNSSQIHLVGQYIDRDRDGTKDFVISYQDAQQGHVQQAWKGTLSGWQRDDSLAPPTAMIRFDTNGQMTYQSMELDLNADGVNEWVDTSAGTGGIHTHSVLPDFQSGLVPGQLHRITSPLGENTELFYNVSVDPSVYQGAPQTAYPDIAFNHNRLLVASVAADDGLGGWLTVEHRYGGGKVNMEGLGGLGMAFHEATDPDIDMVMRTDHYQTYPYVGMLSHSRRTMAGVVQSTGSTSMDSKLITLPNGNSTQYPYAVNTVTDTFDPNSGRSMTTTEVMYEYDDYGNKTKETKTVTRHDYDPDDIEWYLVEQETLFDQDINRWLLSLPTRTTTRQRTNQSTTDHVMVTTSDYDSHGRLIESVLMPDHVRRVTKSFSDYDIFGNVGQIVESAVGQTDRLTQRIYSSDGRFIKQTTNAAGEIITIETDPVQGKPLLVTDGNGLQKEFLYDGFGTVIREGRVHQDTGASYGVTVMLPRWCDDPQYHCPAGAVYFIGSVDNSGDAPEYVYYNGMGKEIKRMTTGFDDRSVILTTTYDHRGQKTEVSRPYFSDNAIPRYDRYEYDVPGRVVKHTNLNGAQFIKQYDGFTVTSIVPGNATTGGTQTSIVVNGLRGKPIRSIDNHGNVTRYRYDVAGNLVSTIFEGDNQDNGQMRTVVSIKYDVFNRKIEMDDPDMGVWQYRYDAFGNLIEQRDAKGQISTMEYDVLNRMVKRTDQDGVTEWRYGDDPTRHEIGRLSEVRLMANGAMVHNRSQEYDSYGRLSHITTQIDDQVYTQRVGYRSNTDKMEWMEYPSNRTLLWTYDDVGYPEKVQGVSLNYDEYLVYQQKVSELHSLERQLEAWKTNHLSAMQLSQLAEHEAEYAWMVETLQDFNTQLEEDNQLQGYRDEADSYQTLLENTEYKITQHADWLKIYSDKVRPVSARISVLYESVYPDMQLIKQGSAIRTQLDDLYAQIQSVESERNEAINAANYWQGRINEHIRQEQLPYINDNFIYHINSILRNILKSQYEAQFVIDINNPDRADSINNIRGYMIDPANSESDITGGINAITSYANQIDYWTGRFEDARRPLVSAFERANAEIRGFNAELQGLSAQYNPVKSRFDTIQDRIVQANEDIDTLSDVLKAYRSPVASHSNIQRAFLDRLKVHLKETSLLRGTQMIRENLRPDVFLDNIYRYADYARCRDAGNNDCYHYITGDEANEGKAYSYPSNLDATNTNLAAVANVDITNVWHDLEYFCPSIQYGYRCSTEFSVEIRRLLKTIDCLQRDDWNYQLDADLDMSHCEVNEQVNEGDQLIPGYKPYATISNLALFKTAVTEKHKDLLEQYQCAAAFHYGTACETAESIWTSKGTSDTNKEEAGDFVLMYSGLLQRYAGNIKTDRVKQAEQDYQYHADQINTILAAQQSLVDQIAQKREEVNSAYELALVAQSTQSSQSTEQLTTYWSAKAVNAQGQIMQAQYGNGLVTQYGYDNFGRIGHILTEGNNQAVINRSFEYDRLGNLTHRSDFKNSLFESFEYDDLNRLTQTDLQGTGAQWASLLGQSQVSYEYDDLGNMTYKSDVGHYAYGSLSEDADLEDSSHGLPHAVKSIQGRLNTSFSYDDNGNMLSGKGRSIEYTSFNKPRRIVDGDRLTELVYGVNRELIKKTETISGIVTITRYVGANYEEVAHQGDSPGTYRKVHVSVSGQVIATVRDKLDEVVSEQTRYLHKNHQGSVIALSNEQGYVTEEHHYDAFGKERAVLDVSAPFVMAGILAFSTKGFTGHERMAGTGLIHMVGRVYDPELGRFLSADPHIQSPLMSQSLNRYSYVLNNPLSFTDPSGYFFSSLFKSIKKLWKKIGRAIKKLAKVITSAVKSLAKVIRKVVKFIRDNIRVVIAVAVAVAAPYALAAVSSVGGFLTTAGTLTLKGSIVAGAIGGGLAGLITTGSLKGLVQGAILGAVTAGFAKSLGTAGSKLSKFASNWTHGERILRIGFHGVIGGVRSVINGGKFLRGFFTGAVSKFSTGGVVDALGSSNAVVQGLAVASVGGLLSQLAGGDFATGFVTAGVAFALNYKLTESAAAQKEQFQRDPIRGRAGVFGSIKAKVYGFFGVEADVDLLSFHSGSNPEGSNPLITQGGGLRATVGNNSYGFSISRQSTDGGGTWSDWHIDPVIIREFHYNNNGGVNTTLGIGLFGGGELDLEVIQGAQ